MLQLATELEGKIRFRGFHAAILVLFLVDATAPNRFRKKDEDKNG